ncbi:MAG: PEP-CTERM sorting domain-containing protein [Akkermansia sp.]|nr:PEP-CTERM sorting domain-containing protein [Akkermansia sp.]
MKKTIAILALAAGFSSVTMAETITMGPEQLIGEPGKTLTVTTVLNTVQFKDALSSNTTATILTLNGVRLSDGAMTWDFNTYVGVKGGKLEGAWDSPTQTTIKWGYGLGVDVSNIWYGAAASALTLVGTTNNPNVEGNWKGTIAVLSVVYHDGTIKHYDGYNEGLRFTDNGNNVSDRHFSGYQFESDFVDYNNGPVYNFGSYASKEAAIAAAQGANAIKIAHLAPEPTTATLSLLALAGLAARRRRK